MKFIYKNLEVIVLLFIIFFIFFGLVIMYETKIKVLEYDLNQYKKDDYVSVNALYFSSKNNYYNIAIEVEDKITNNYIKVLTIYGNEEIIYVNDNASLGLSTGKKYNLVIEKVSNDKIYSTQLQKLINKNKLITIEEVN